ncbi:MAG TPA: FAD-dependent monooxygenase [Mycobacterium sp.]|nr:FAD-dependent monooxygenase [Mycobacterium sp.]
MDHNYDAIVVGGRPAGAATAMLLARGGMRVLVVEAARPGADTLSTHVVPRDLSRQRGPVMRAPLRC